MEIGRDGSGRVAGRILEGMDPGVVAVGWRLEEMDPDIIARRILEGIDPDVIAVGWRLEEKIGHCCQSFRSTMLLDSGRCC